MACNSAVRMDAGLRWRREDVLTNLLNRRNLLCFGI